MQSLLGQTSWRLRPWVIVAGSRFQPQDPDRLMDSTQWYVAVDGKAVGPVSTELLIRGLEQGKVPVDALVCAAGEAEWQDVTRVPPFSYELFGAEPPDPEPESRAGVNRDPFAAARAVAPEIAQPNISRDSDYDDRADEVTPAAGIPAPTPELFTTSPEPSPPAGTLDAQSRGTGLDVDIVFDTFDDETKPRYYNWARPIAPYFQPLESIELPDESLLIGSLPTAPVSLLTQEEALWNVALCLAFGSKALAEAVADRFFEVVAELGAPAKVEWMVLTLLSRGFMPSGIPKDSGQNGFATLLRRCPDEFQDYLV